MNRIKRLVLLLFLISSTQLFSDNHVISYGMEGYQCNLQPGKDLNDVMKFVEESLNPHADKYWSAPYSGFVMTPFLRSEEIDFDFAWVGFTNNHKDLGIIQDSWFSEAAASTSEEWASLSDCFSQGYYMAIEARTPTVPFVEGENTYFAVYSCSFKEGKSVKDLAENDKAWNEYNDKRGFTGGVWRWVPGAGTSNSFEGDFFLNVSYNSWEELGEYLDDSFWGKTPRPESILNCDKPRVYASNNARNRPFEVSEK